VRREAVEVAPGVVVMTSGRYATTSTIVRRGTRALLVDPAWTVPELDAIRDRLAADGTTVATGFSTHAHHDHLLWHPDFGDAPRYASPATVRCAAEWHGELRAQLDDDYRIGFPDSLLGLLPVVGDHLPDPFADGCDEPVQLVVHDGHAPGHTAVWLAERGVLLAGDMLSDVELPLPFDPDDLEAYLAALDALGPAVERVDVLVPGHGRVTDRPIDRLDADRRYLDAVLRGADPEDSRRANPGMDAAHRRIVELARTRPS
jgi:glyoxylase-like metal-dependent hydrolase (beta-lactamase superfamily II)